MSRRGEWFSQIWAVKGTRQTASQLERRTAAYPEEIAERLIRMFSVKGELVLDPFLGSQVQQQKVPCKTNATASDMKQIQICSQL